MNENFDRPLGWRARIGVMSPTVMETINNDFFRVAPDGVTMCAITSNVEFWDNSNFQQSVIDPLISMAKYLGSRGVDYIMHCGMPVVTLRGKGFEDEVQKMITEATGLPSSTSIKSAIKAFQSLNARNIAILSPYPDVVHKSAIKFLEDSGFHIVKDHTEDVVFKQLQDVIPRRIVEIGCELVKPSDKVDCVYIPCNQWRGLDAAIHLEKRLGIPCVSGAHADMWEAFKTLEIDNPLPGNGVLFEALRKS